MDFLTSETSKEISDDNARNSILKDKHRRVLRTTVLIFSFTAYGLVNSMVYSSLPDFRERLSCSTDDLSTAISLGASGTFAAIPLGILADKYLQYSDLFIAFSLVLAAVVNTVRPFGRNLFVFALSEFFDDMAWATIENTANSEIPRMWKEKGQSPMLAMHLGYPVGAAVGAQIASFFVSKKSNLVHFNITTTHGRKDSYHFQNITLNTSLNDEKEYPDYKSHIEIAFIIAGVYILIVAVVFVLLQCCRESISAGTDIQRGSNWKEIFMPSKWSENDSSFGIKILLFFIFYAIFLCGCSASMGSFVTLYAVDSHLNFDPPEAATLVAVSKITDAISTFFCAVCLTRFLSVKIMLMIEIHGLLLASVGALILGTKYKIALYFFVCLFQMCKGPSYASIFSWVDHYVLPLCTLLGVVRIIRNGCYILFVRLQGYLYDYVSIEIIFYTSVGCTVALCLSAYMIYYVTYRIPYRYSLDSRMVNDNEQTELVNTSAQNRTDTK